MAVKHLVAFGVSFLFLVGVARADPEAIERERLRRADLAKAIAIEAKKKYDLADWPEAYRLYQESYDVFEDPPILFNICQVRRKLGEYEKALETCKAFLRNFPAAPNRPQVQRLIKTLEAQLEALKNTAAKSPPQGTMPEPEKPQERPAPADDKKLVETVDDDDDADEIEEDGELVPLRSEAEHRPWWKDRWGWTALGAGLAVSAVGVGFLLNASNLDDEADGERDQTRLQELRDRASSRRTTGTVLAAVGGAGVAFGIVKLSFKW